MVLNLVRQFSQMGVQVDLLVLRADSPHLHELPAGVNLVRLKARHTLTAIPELVRWFRQQKPTAMLVAKDRAGRAALTARFLAGSHTRIVIRLGTNLSTALANRSPLHRWLRVTPMRLIYPAVDAVVAVSEGVRQDTLAITRLPPAKVHVVRNPVITTDLFDQAKLDVQHQWLLDKTAPVIMAAGRLAHQKGFDILVRAFAELIRTRDARLIILGEGAYRGRLDKLASELGVLDRVDLPGFQSHIYAWLAKADLFVLSSRWEGSPNVLTEALALGVASVATRCPSGPDEILQDGRFGELVAVDDVTGLAAAMARTLDNPMPADHLQAAVDEYRAEISARAYLKLLEIEF